MLEAAVVMAFVALITVVVVRVVIPALADQPEAEPVRIPTEEIRRHQ
jgi:hypothetical protein